MKKKICYLIGDLLKFKFNKNILSGIVVKYFPFNYNESQILYFKKQILIYNESKISSLKKTNINEIQI